jgi:uncharacterized protein
VVLAAQPSAGLFRGPPAYQPRTPWSPWGAVLAAVLIVAVSIVGAVLLLGAGTVADATGGTRVAGRWQLANQDSLALVTLAIWQTIAVVLTIGASALFGGRPADVLALRAPAGPRAVYLQAIVLMVALQVVVSVVQHTLFADDIFSDLRPMARMLGGEEWLLALLVVGVGAPLSEELLFRGFLLSALARSRLGFVGASLLSSGAWTALHAGYSTAGIIEVFLIGLFFSWLLWRTGSLRVALFCHALYNSLIVLVLRHVPLPA